MSERTRSKPSPGRSFGRLASLALTTLVVAAMACDQAPTDPETVDASSVADGDASKSSSAMMNSNAPFPVFHQGFEHDTEAWIDGSDPGPLGWCGSIERVPRGSGSVMPSAGSAHATVEDGACNAFWTGVFGSEFTSGPASSDLNLLSTGWPASGFVQELDVYLDPAETDDGVAFIYANSLCVFGSDPEPCGVDFDFRYFAVVVTAREGAMDVAGHPVTEAGWYTFRHVFGSQGDGTLTVDFQLMDDGRPLHSAPVEGTLLTGESTSDFDVEDLGSGYIWIVSIADGLALPIDQHQLRPGS